MRCSLRKAGRTAVNHERKSSTDSSWPLCICSFQVCMHRNSEDQSHAAPRHTLASPFQSCTCRFFPKQHRVFLRKVQHRFLLPKLLQHRTKRETYDPCITGSAEFSPCLSKTGSVFFSKKHAWAALGFPLQKRT
jgi:hypothetical protein